MTAREPIFDLSAIDLDTVIADQEEIRRRNRQRYEMEQLTAIVCVDADKNACLGYKDVSEQEFWVRGHLPGAPLMPGVIICEAAAQLASFFVHKMDWMGGDVLGFGGLEDVRFRGLVRPGERLFVAVQLTKVRPGRMIVCRFQAWVNKETVCEGVIKGIPLPDELFTE